MNSLSVFRTVRNRRSASNQLGRVFAFTPSPQGATRRISIAPEWNARLQMALGGVLDFTASCKDDYLVTAAFSTDGRAILELIEISGELDEASLQIARPVQKGLEAVMLDCWALLYLTALFPRWSNVSHWLNLAVSWAIHTGTPT